MESGPRIDGRDGQDGTPAPQAPPPGPSGVPDSFVREISGLWSDFLDGREVGADDDFFALGGNSLIGIRIIDRVLRDYGVELSVRAFYLAQTPARVAGLIVEERDRACG